VLQSSFLRDTQTKGWCKKCNAYTPITQIRRLNNLPPVLSINCGAINEDDLKYWRSKDQYFRFDESDYYRHPEQGNARPFNPFLPLRIEIALQDEQSGLAVHEFGPSEIPLDKSEACTDQKATYELTSIICQVENGQEPTHLVAFVRTPAAEPESKSDDEVERHPYSKYRWFLVNDFLVRSVTVQEAVQFRSHWKIPAIVLYHRVDVDEGILKRASALPQRLSRNLITKMAAIHK
jgi:PAB-dependent poly(A)-specific ribonuclease subunit 2